MTGRDPLATQEEVAEHLRMPVDTVRTWRSRGKGPKHITVGRHVRYRWSDVERWLQQQTTGGAR